MSGRENAVMTTRHDSVPHTRRSLVVHAEQGRCGQVCGAQPPGKDQTRSIFGENQSVVFDSRQWLFNVSTDDSISAD